MPEYSPKIDPTQDKQCTKCNQRKPRTLEYFPPAKMNKDGLSSWCRLCQYEAARHWAKNNPEKLHKLQSHWVETNPDKVHDKYKRWREKNIEKIARSKKVWAKNNPEKTRAKVQRREALKRSLPATLTQQEWEDIKAEFNYCCAYCGASERKLGYNFHQEHVIPLSRGGGYTRENIVPACRSCNSRKGNRTPEEAGMRLLKPRSAALS